MHKFINSSISYRGLILIFIDVPFEITRGETRAKVNRIGFAVTNCVDWFSSLDITLCSPKLKQRRFSVSTARERKKVYFDVRSFN